MKETCIIFDMDGTLIDSSAAMTHSVNHVREHLGLGALSKKELEYYINEPDQDLPRILYNTPEYNPEHRALFKEHYIHSSLKSELYPDVDVMLNYLSQRAHLCIATNANDFFAHHMLEGLGIKHYFSAIAGSNNVAAPKPSPLMIEHLIATVGCDASKTLLVGDSIKDEEAALNAGIDFIFAAWGYGRAQSANLRAHNIHELIALLNTFI